MKAKDKNNETILSSDDSIVRLMNIPANEEMLIAQQAYSIITQQCGK